MIIYVANFLCVLHCIFSDYTQSDKISNYLYARLSNPQTGSLSVSGSAEHAHAQSWKMVGGPAGM